jgi:FAD/FMN-containing dehydrogenase/Fe-S oxidoreductase
MDKSAIEQLENELKQTIEGEVRFDDGSRAMYATDASNYRQVPIGVVIPKNKQDVIKTVQLCHKYKAPILCRGGGTSLAGQCCNVAIVIDMSKYFNKILEIDYENKTATVEPGCVLDTLRNAAEKHHLTFAPDPSTHYNCTLGGMIGNNSCGVHSLTGGKTDDNVLELEVLTYDGILLKVGKTSPDKLKELMNEEGRTGEIYRKLKQISQKYAKEIEDKFPNIPRRVSGYNFPWLLEKNGFDVAKALVGSESTCVIILEAKLRLIYSPPVKALVVLGFSDVYVAADKVNDIMAYSPFALEGFDIELINDIEKKKLNTEYISLLPAGKGWLLAQFGGETQEEARERALKLVEGLKTHINPPFVKLYADKESQNKIQILRESGLGASARVPNEKEAWEGWEDAAVHPENLGNYLREFRALLKKYNYRGSLYGHFGQACVHTRIDFDLYTKEGIDKYHDFIHEGAHLVVKYNGSLSGEHGDGQSRGELLPIMFGNELIQAFREFKSLWDPEWKMNPGKMIDPHLATEDLRLGPDYNPKEVKTHFKFPGEDEGSFALATLRCVGVGKCRRNENGTMCPSYMATKEEADSTRGRARLLFEMLQGQVIGKDGWKDESVKKGLDLCLACKGCKKECPMNVDMATYKAEFLSHYYEGRLRPRSAYAFGLIYWWSKIATHIPRISNFFTKTPPFSMISKWIVGTDSKRTIPPFAQQNFKKWFFKREKKPTGHKKVILWADTFSNNFHPEHAIAATEVLEHLGFDVCVPKASLCCGRPLYDYGMLDKAKDLLIQILKELKDEIRAGTPIVGLEPSCISVFRDELCNLFPTDMDAKRLKDQTFMLSEFIQHHAKDYKFKPLNKKAIVHGHCHHKTVLHFEYERELLERLGLDFKILDSGCCGMAGSFGFEKEHYDVSMKIGERVLLPAVRNAHKDELIITNGFSCQEQILQGAGKKSLHIAQVLKMSIDQVE